MTVEASEPKMDLLFETEGKKQNLMRLFRIFGVQSSLVYRRSYIIKTR